MEQRKLIKFGASSHVLSMPNYWLKKNNLKKGDVVFVEESNEGNIVLSTGVKEKNEVSSITIEADNKSVDRIEREIFSAYTNNYNLIKIKGKNLRDVVKNIRRSLHSFVALEIIEEDDTKIIAKDFLNLKDVSVNENIRRIDIILRGMMQDMIKCVYNDCSASIYERDYDINRFCFLVLRAINGAMDDPNILRSLKIKNNDLIPTWLLCLYLEDIGDEIKRVSRFLKNHEFDEKVKKELYSGLSIVEKIYLDAMKSYYTQNYELAFNVDLEKDNIVNDFNKLFDKYPVPGIARISERLKKLVSGIGSVAQIVYGAGTRRKD